MVTGSENTGGREPAERRERIERIREALDRGVYLVDGAAVAGKMVDAAVRTFRLRGHCATRGGSPEGEGFLPPGSCRCGECARRPPGAERAEAEPPAPSGTGRQPRLATVHPIRRRS